MNNSVFRKTIENAKNRVGIKLGDKELALKQHEKMNFMVLVKII